ncbi:MAG: acyl carrier protein [Terriglobales bacterium]
MAKPSNKPRRAVANGKANGKNGKPVPAAAKKPQPKALAPAKKDSAPPAKAAPKPVSKAVEKKTRQQSELEGKLLHMIAEEMAIEEAELTPEAVFKDDLNLDEIDVAELLMQSEANFGVHPFSEADWEACTTVGQFLQLVGKRVEAKRSRKRS